MYWRLRVDVAKCNHLFILMNDGGGNLLLRNLAKQAIHRHCAPAV
jgi:hypothetical protein